MSDILEELYAIPEKGADPDVIYRAANEIERLRNTILDRCCTCGAGENELHDHRDDCQARNMIVGPEHPFNYIALVRHRGETEWKDTTTYAQGQRGKVDPTTFTAMVDDLSVTVSCGYIHHSGEWVMHCQRLDIQTRHLPDCGSVDEAKRRAVNIVRKEANTLAERAAKLDA